MPHYRHWIPPADGAFSVMLKFEGVLHFTIPVKNLDRSEKFYTEVL